MAQKVLPCSVRATEDNILTMFSIFPTRTASFGELKSKSSITDAVISAAQNAVEDSKADYLSELKYAKENSFLDGLDELNIDVEFQQTAETSIAYTVLQRLGINADEVFEREDFPKPSVRRSVKK